ncbi:hypothetical protein BKA62DRAFT_775607 [Auriculariales sp. MPI-PUGE-AT-0066]|nr:hypothetical protein BKA62DRAFT_775607 [Auriculariales sp. MPI-PUGE-AT-0066]
MPARTPTLVSPLFILCSFFLAVQITSARYLRLAPSPQRIIGHSVRSLPAAPRADPDDIGPVTDAAGSTWQVLQQGGTVDAASRDDARLVQWCPAQAGSGTTKDILIANAKNPSKPSYLNVSPPDVTAADADLTLFLGLYSAQTSPTIQFIVEWKANDTATMLSAGMKNFTLPTDADRCAFTIGTAWLRAQLLHVSDSGRTVNDTAAIVDVPADRPLEDFTISLLNAHEGDLLFAFNLTTNNVAQTDTNTNTKTQLPPQGAALRASVSVAGWAVALAAAGAMLL